MKYELLHPGMTRYHHISLLLPVLTAFSPMLFARLDFGPLATHHKALVCGVITTIAAYLWMLLVQEPNPYPKSLLLGLLVAEFMLFGASPRTPSIVNLMLFVFIYFYAITKL